MSRPPGEDDGRSLLAFDFGGTKLGIAVFADPGGGDSAPLLPLRSTLLTEADKGAERAVERAFAAALDLLRGEPPAAIGVSTMGYTRHDGVSLAPNVPGWEALRLPAMIESRFPGARCRIENDVRAAGMAELSWGALRGADPAVFLNLGTGIAAATFVGGRLLAGRHGTAGEVGYAVVSDREGNLVGLEDSAGGAGVLRRTGMGFADLVSAAGDPDGELDAVIGAISTVLVSVAATLDPERIAVGGGYAGAGERLLAPLRQSLARLPIAPQLVAGRFGADAGIYGAAALALQALGSPGALPDALSPIRT